MSNNNTARLHVVSEEWIEEEKRALTYSEFLELFFKRVGRLYDAKNAIDRQLAQNEEARMRLRKESLQQAAQIQTNDEFLNELIRDFLPDTSDPVIKLIDSAIDFLNQLRAVAEHRSGLHSDLGDLAALLAINPAVIRSALIGIAWPLEEKLSQLTEFSLARDIEITQPNK